jgi:lysozyme
MLVLKAFLDNFKKYIHNLVEREPENNKIKLENYNIKSITQHDTSGFKLGETNMNINDKGIKLLHEFESCRLEAYQCSAKVWTIGWGNTFYESGEKVKQGDTVTQKRADELFFSILKNFEMDVRTFTKSKINEDQYSALVCFSYNVGSRAFLESTLLKRVNENPNDPRIALEFMRWTIAGGKKSLGLYRRREAEARLYFSMT